MSRFIELFNTHFSLALSKAVKSSRLTTQLASESFCTHTQLLETIKQSGLELQGSSLLQNKETVHAKHENRHNQCPFYAHAHNKHIRSLGLPVGTVGAGEERWSGCQADRPYL